MDKLISVWYILTLLMAILNFVVGVWCESTYNIVIGIMDWLIAMSVKKLIE